MTRLPVETDSAIKFCKTMVQVETVDGRAWAYKAVRFFVDDPRAVKLLAALNAPGATIDPRHWRQVSALGRYS